jgi:hypothetical protein
VGGYCTRCCAVSLLRGLTGWVYRVMVCAAALQALSSLSASKQPLRDAWASWNPQRAAALDLQQQIEEGTLTLEVSTHIHRLPVVSRPSQMQRRHSQQRCCSRTCTNPNQMQCKQRAHCLRMCFQPLLHDTIKAYQEAASPVSAPEPGHLDPQQARTLGWYPYGKPWLWPAPRDPATYNTHPLKPSDSRVEELQEAWQEGGLAAAEAAAQAASKGGTVTDRYMHTPLHSATLCFTAFSVH